MELKNKNKKLFHLKENGVLVIDVIPAPVYTCQGETLTEYDLRNLQVQVAEGNICYQDINSLQIMDSLNNPVVFREDGTLMHGPYGYDLSSSMTLRVIKINRQKNK